MKMKTIQSKSKFKFTRILKISLGRYLECLLNKTQRFSLIFFWCSCIIHLNNISIIAKYCDIFNLSGLRFGITNMFPTSVVVAGRLWKHFTLSACGIYASLRQAKRAKISIFQLFQCHRFRATARQMLPWKNLWVLTTSRLRFSKKDKIPPSFKNLLPFR